MSLLQIPFKVQVQINIQSFKYCSTFQSVYWIQKKKRQGKSQTYTRATNSLVNYNRSLLDSQNRWVSHLWQYTIEATWKEYHVFHHIFVIWICNGSNTKTGRDLVAIFMQTLKIIKFNLDFNKSSLFGTFFSKAFILDYVFWLLKK